MSQQAKREAAARGVAIIDFGQGDPREPTDPLIRQALADGVAETMSYPKAEGLPELRAAIAGWIDRRFGVMRDPDRELIPTLGSKEAIFSFAQVFADVPRGKDTVLVPYGWHGPCVAAPGFDMYYLNVMAGPGAERAWKISDHPDQAWVRSTWETQDIDPRLVAKES